MDVDGFSHMMMPLDQHERESHNSPATSPRKVASLLMSSDFTSDFTFFRGHGSESMTNMLDTAHVCAKQQTSMAVPTSGHKSITCISGIICSWCFQGAPSFLTPSGFTCDSPILWRSPMKKSQAELVPSRGHNTFPPPWALGHSSEESLETGRWRLGHDRIKALLLASGTW